MRVFRPAILVQRRLIPLAVLLLAAFFSLARVSGGSVTLIPVADTTLISTVPDNNNGRQPFFNAGITQNGTTNHGVLRFDLAGQIHAGAKILSADLVVEVTRQPKDGYSPGAFELHRLLQPWGEGDKTFSDPRSPGLGAPTATNEATWVFRFAYTTNVWAIPGGAAGIDYIPEISSSETIYNVGDSPYRFGSTPRMVADVQSWLDDPATNFGWLLKTTDELTRFTARRFGSREDPDTAPKLIIEFTVPLRITGAKKHGSEFILQFSAQTGKTYAVQARDTFAHGEWTTLTNFVSPADADVTFTNTTSTAQQFYRVSEQ